MRYEPKAKPKNFCRECGKDFRSTWGFERHRVGSFVPLNRRCLTVPELIAKGYDLDAYGRWYDVKRAIEARERFENALQRLRGRP